MGGVTLPDPHAAPRLSDIAAQAEVSEATVSRVLNGKAGVGGGGPPPPGGGAPPAARARRPPPGRPPPRPGGGGGGR
ncbi:LacI family DNA-binding transcriptional regulator, partial [Streptomyces tubercidicus]|uniref:LacI family DNA-binding transcriptional regulator n=1 Tax=Streptomyces tubercidicus TaxID=47759 RepID=UPI003798B557